MAWEWYEWESLEAFNVWHESIKVELGYPKPSINQATGEVDESAQWSVEYTDAIELDGKVIAVVESDKSEGLFQTNLRPPVREYGDQS
ncbi:MAG TPA: hypothetical protein DCF63_15290 [Planctomycetaceae bacterium]|nr:hypothetical protein [Planctomycetaceae bacterium]